MNVTERNQLFQEAALQTKALGKIERWKKIALALSALGVAFTYAGYAGQLPHPFYGISGITLILAGTGSAAVINLGIRNGKRNVEKILGLLEMNKSCHIS
ncbi:MAG: hypothetical protein HFG55_08095 [Lachnospiraceae bacterium]|nr:hypothetical protein [Lachnospiraceae bacterium]